MLTIMQLIDRFQHIFEHDRQFNKIIIAPLAVLRDLQNGLFRRINDLIGITTLRAQRGLCNIVGSRYQFT